jgi:hypothetical protein
MGTASFSVGKYARTRGTYIPAGIQAEFECNDPGLVSIIDVA